MVASGNGPLDDFLLDLGFVELFVFRVAIPRIPRITRVDRVSGIAGMARIAGIHGIARIAWDAGIAGIARVTSSWWTRIAGNARDAGIARDAGMARNAGIARNAGSARNAGNARIAIGIAIRPLTIRRHPGTLRMRMCMITAPGITLWSVLARMLVVL